MPRSSMILSVLLTPGNAPAAGRCLIRPFFQIVPAIIVPSLVNSTPVLIFQNACFVGCNFRMTIQLNQEDFYQLACGDHIAFRVPAGKSIMFSQTTQPVTDNVDVDIEKANQYYLKSDCAFGACSLEEITLKQYKPLVKRCNDLIKVGF